MRVAFWNCTLGGSSSRLKTNCFKDWVQERAPSLLCLEEVSEKLLHGSPADITNLAPGYKVLAYCNTLDKNENPTTKCIAALARSAEVQSYGMQARAMTFPGLEQTRMLVKVTMAMNMPAVWVIHANASKSGGERAIESVSTYLTSGAGRNAIVGGDFNCKIERARNIFGTGNCKAVKARSHNLTRLNFTQWNDQAHSAIPNALLAQYHLSIANAPRYGAKLIKPNFGPIDYLAHGEEVGVQKCPNCASEAVWWDILCNFDHCPVVYEVNE